MKLRLIAVGRPRDAEELALHERYAARLRRLGTGYEACWVRAAASRGAADDDVRRREARALLEQHDGRGTLVALDPRGRLLTSPELAQRLERWATPRATFLVGGPLGLSEELLRDAAVRWSLSPLTFPHELVPALLAEQLYRALCILRGSPYHKPRAADA